MTVMFRPIPSVMTETGSWRPAARPPVERELRAGHVGDHEVPGRAARTRVVDRRNVSRAAREKTAGGMKWLASWSRLGGQRAVALLHVAERLVRAAQPLDRVGHVGEQRRAHQQDAVAVGADLLAGAHRHRDLRDERLVGQLVVREQPAPHRARADRHDDVVDRAAVAVLDRLDLVERELAEREAPVRRDPPVERRPGGARVARALAAGAARAVRSGSHAAARRDRAEDRRRLVDVGQRRRQRAQQPAAGSAARRAARGRASRGRRACGSDAARRPRPGRRGPPG